MEGPALTVFVLLLLIIWFAPGSNVADLTTNEPTSDPAIARRQGLDILQTSRYGDLANHQLNLTGFRKQDGFDANAVLRAQRLLASQTGGFVYGASDHLALYRNIDGELGGRFTGARYDSNSTGYRTDIGNSTVSSPWEEVNQAHPEANRVKGKIDVYLEDVRPYTYNRSSDSEARLNLQFDDNFSTKGQEYSLYGVHLADQSIILTTLSPKWNGLPALPHMALDTEGFYSATELLNRTTSRLWYGENLEKLQIAGAQGRQACEIIMWLQQKPLPYTSQYVEQIESELLAPKGAPVKTIPALQFSAVVLSPDCGFLLQVASLTGPRAEVLDDLKRRALLALIFVLAVKIMLTTTQINRSNSPSRRSRIAIETIYLSALGSGLIMLGMLICAVLDTNLWLLASVACFLAILNVSFIELHFLLDIWAVQVGDPAEAERLRALQQHREVTANADQQRSLPLSEAGLPLPATARLNTEPATLRALDLPFNQDGTTLNINPATASTMTFFTKFYLMLVGIAYVSFWATTLHTRTQGIYFRLLNFVLCSLWMPQIYRNAMQNRRKALEHEYVVGTSLCTLVITFYFWAVPRNVFGTTTSGFTMGALGLWVLAQMVLLISQEYFGPRWFVKERWCPETYNYHRVLDQSQRDKNESLDCAICMNDIVIPAIPNSSPQLWPGRDRIYMVTPCNHVFHPRCLETWMDTRLICPVCRDDLPPI